MLESLVIDRIIYILDNNIPITEIPNLVIVDNKNIIKRESIYAIEIRLKKQVNTLVLKYGIVGALIKLLELKHDLSSLADNSNVFLLFTGIKTLYERILGYYTPIVYAKLVKWLPRLAEGTITSLEILTDVKKLPFNNEFLLGITESSMEQISLFGIVTEEPSNELVIAVNNKNNVKKSAIKALTSIFSKSEIMALCFKLSEILNTTDDIQSTIFLRCFLKEVQELMTPKNKKTKDVTRQLKIKQF